VCTAGAQKHLIKVHDPVPCLKDHTQGQAGELTVPGTLGAAGVTLSGGRIIGETDRLVHLLLIPLSRETA
jgi:hypothetical protein